MGANFEGARNQVQVQDDGGSTETKLDNLRTNQVQGWRDIEEAREVKEHSSKVDDLGTAKRNDTEEGNKKGSYA